MKDLKGKTAFISGGAEGIGFHVGRLFGRQGMNVMLADIDTQMLDQAVQTLKGEGLTVAGIPLDVSLREEWEQAAERTVDTFGKVHLLMGNAGVAVTGSIPRSPRTGCWKPCRTKSFSSLPIPISVNCTTCASRPSTKDLTGPTPARPWQACRAKVSS